MDLPRAGQENAYVTLANEPNPQDVVQASVDECVTWHPVTVTGNQTTVLLRGPDYADDQLGLLVSANATRVWLRVKSDPESLPRVAAVVFLY